MSPRTRLLLVLASLLAALAGCARGEGQNHALAVEAPATARVGQAARTVVRLTPRGEWHVNIAYPFQLTVRPPQGVDLPQPRMTAADGRVSEKEARFEVPFTPTAAGPKAFEGVLKFSVCTDRNCDIQEARVTWHTTAH
jgi:hypothetical protein